MKWLGLELSTGPVEQGVSTIRAAAVAAAKTHRLEQDVEMVDAIVRMPPAPTFKPTRATGRMRPQGLILSPYP